MFRETARQAGWRNKPGTDKEPSAKNIEQTMRWAELADEKCTIARTVSVIGDRWTLLILRDCFLRIRRFDDFEARLGITRHVLADRLRKLVEAGVLEKVPYGDRPVRYEYRLTQKGLDLYPVMMSIVHWGDIHTAGKSGRPLLHHHLSCGHAFDPVLTCSVCAQALEPRQVRVLPGPGAGRSHRQASPNRQAAGTPLDEFPKGT
jgi:DNA-binding HxlR family transcriptional regulator